MGNCQNGCSTPNTTNVCNALGDTYTLPGFCTIGGPAGDGYRNTWCGNLGADGEWTRDVGVPSLNTCFFNSCKPYEDCGGECIQNNCPSILGNGAVCKRIGFTGDPGPCCLNDYVCNDNTNNCFSDQSQRNTCDTKYRDATSSDCRAAIIDYCSGANDSTDSWMLNWTQGKCYNALVRNLYNQNLPGAATCFAPPPRAAGTPCNSSLGNFTTSGFYWGQELMQEVLKKYASQGYILGAAPNEPGYNQFQEYLYDNVCCSFPSLCSGGLRVACSNKSLQSITANPQSANWCGCYLDPRQYDDIVTKYGVEIPCTSTCNRSTSIPLVGVAGVPLKCTQNVCLIDDAAVTLIANTGTPNVNFNQLCGGCKAGECNCTIGNSDITLVNDVLRGANIDYQNVCGSLTCQGTNSGDYGPQTVVGPCNSDTISQIQSEIDTATTQKKIKQAWWILVIFILLIIAIGLILLL